MPNSRQIVYIYDGDSSKGDIEQDYDGDIPIPQQNAVISRNGENWRVIAVNEENTVGVPKAWPVFRIYLQRV